MVVEGDDLGGGVRGEQARGRAGAAADVEHAPAGRGGQQGEGATGVVGAAGAEAFEAAKEFEVVVREVSVHARVLAVAKKGQ